MHDDESFQKSFGLPTQRKFDAPRFEAAITEMLAACGVDADAHTQKTAYRVRKLWQERLLGGYEADIAETLGAGFDDDGEDLVILKGISIHGVCPHHLLPFRGVAHVAYQPAGRLHGFGRIARLVDAIANRFTYQEWITRNIAEALMQYGGAKGAAVIVDAEQMCLLLGENRRGEERVRTSSFLGSLKDNLQMRADFFAGIRTA